MEAQGGIYGPYSGRWFDSTTQTDIEHILARSEAHDSGLCAADAETRKAFSSDLLNLTLASSSVNRYQKSAKDAAEWLPDLNECWYADRIVQVRQKYGLTIDQAEVAALNAVLAGCDSVVMVVVARPTPTPKATKAPPSQDRPSAYSSCEEAQRAGEPRVKGSKGNGRGFPKSKVPSARDGDGDGVVCEK